MGHVRFGSPAPGHETSGVPHDMRGWMLPVSPSGNGAALWADEEESGWITA